MATYYLSQSGTAADKESSNATNGMNVTVHNAETFAAGDVIEIIDQGGAITSTITPPSDGTIADPVVYNFNGIEVNPASGEAMLLSNRDGITVNGLEGTGNGAASYFEASGTTGGGATISVIINDLHVKGNDGADCDGVSAGNTSRLVLNRARILNCFDSADPDDSDQGITAHTSAVIVANDCYIDNCTWWANCTADARMTFNGGVMKGARYATIGCSASGTVENRITLNNVRMINSRNARHPFNDSSAAVDSTVKIYKGSYELPADEVEINTPNSTVNGGRVLFEGTKFISAAGAQWDMQAQSGGTYVFSGCNFGDLHTASNNVCFARGGSIYFDGCRINSIVGDGVNSNRFTAAGLGTSTLHMERCYIGEITGIVAEFCDVYSGTIDVVIDDNIFYGGATQETLNIFDANSRTLASVDRNIIINHGTFKPNGTYTSEDGNVFVNSTAFGTNQVSMGTDEIDISLFFNEDDKFQNGFRFTEDGRLRVAAS